jgi:hypothetical protein
MIDKEYLRQLKEEDYIAWSELTGDPVTGLKSDINNFTGFLFLCGSLIMLAGLILYFIT